MRSAVWGSVKGEKSREPEKEDKSLHVSPEEEMEQRKPWTPSGGNDRLRKQV